MLPTKRTYMTSFSPSSAGIYLFTDRFSNFDSNIKRIKANELTSILTGIVTNLWFSDEFRGIKVYELNIRSKSWRQTLKFNDKNTRLIIGLCSKLPIKIKTRLHVTSYWYLYW